MRQAWVAASLLVVACSGKVITESSGNGGAGGNSPHEGAGSGGQENTPGRGGAGVGPGMKAAPGAGGFHSSGGTGGNAASNATVEGGCPAIACGSVATIRVPLWVEYAKLRKGAIRACRNGACLTLAPSALPAMPPPLGGGTSVALPGNVGDRVEVTVWTERMALAVVVDWVEVLRPRNGDLYLIEIDVDGSLASVTRKATYQSTSLAGGCGPVCDRASFGRTGVDCCPVSSAPDSSMFLGGGAGPGETCGLTYDFWCTANFRIEQDSDGCDRWRYDERDPAPGENLQCWPVDAGASRDGGTD